PKSMNEDQPIVSPIHQHIGGEEQPRIYSIKYVSRSLIKAVWVLCALIIIVIMMSVDLSSDNVPKPLPPSIKNLLVFFAVAFLAIVLVISFYRKKADIWLDEKGIRFPHGDVLLWES